MGGKHNTPLSGLCGTLGGPSGNRLIGNGWSRSGRIACINESDGESGRSITLLSVGTLRGLDWLRRGGEEDEKLGWGLLCRGDRRLDDNFLLIEWGVVQDLDPAGLNLEYLGGRQRGIQIESGDVRTVEGSFERQNVYTIKLASTATRVPGRRLSGASHGATRALSGVYISCWASFANLNLKRVGS